jgi:hypothetical protein
MFVQVYPDGVSFEASIPYHRLVTEFFLHTVILCQRNDIPVPAEVMARLEKMLEFIMCYTKPDGTVPLIGDGDNGRLVRLGVWDPPEREWVDHRYLLAIGAVLFKRQDFAEAASNQWEEAVWLYPAESPKIMQLAVKRCGDNPRQGVAFALADYALSGYLIAKSQDVYFLVRTGEIGTNGLGNHTHNDGLSFEWSVGNYTLIRDPGAGVYTSDYKSRYLQRSVRSHSTICIDGHELCRLSARRAFSLSGDRHIKGCLLTSPESQPVICELVMEECTGMPLGLVVYRKMELSQEGKYLVITDRIDGTGNHMVERSFVVGRVLRVDTQKSAVVFHLENGRLEIDGTSAGSIQTYVEEVPISDYFGKLDAGKILRYSNKVILPSSLQTCLRWIVD